MARLAELQEWVDHWIIEHGREPSAKLIIAKIDELSSAGAPIPVLSPDGGAVAPQTSSSGAPLATYAAAGD